jgi:hypothetical protein
VASLASRRVFGGDGIDGDKGAKAGFYRRRL